MIIYVYILICAYTVNQLVGFILFFLFFFFLFFFFFILFFFLLLVFLTLNFPASNPTLCCWIPSFRFFSNVDQNSQFSPIAKKYSSILIFHHFPNPCCFPPFPLAPCCPPLFPPGTAAPALGGALPRWATPWRCCWASWPSRPRASRSWSFGARWAPAVEPCARGCRPWSRRQGRGPGMGYGQLWVIHRLYIIYGLYMVI